MNRIVYDSAAGRLNQCPTCGRRMDRCICGQAPSRGRAAAPAAPAAALPRDGVVRVMRDRKGRGGKGVTIVAGLPGTAADLDAMATTLKRLCACGGTVKGDTVEIQGDHRDRIVAALRERGLTVKVAGG